MIVSKKRSIDGLRGHLALAVVMHHFWIAWAYGLMGQWVLPSNTVFRNLGPSAVITFFMITGFLFYGKLIIAVLVPISLHTYRWIEKPFIELGRRPYRQLADAAP